MTNLDLTSEIEKTSAAVHEALGTPAQEPEIDPVEVIFNTIKSLEDSIASMHIGIRVLSTRLSTTEKYIAYLLEKDPEMSGKIKALKEKAAEESKNNEQAL